MTAKTKISILFWFLFAGLFAQNQPPTGKDSSDVYTIVEQPAEFPGGVAAMNEFIFSNLIVPPEVRETGIRGKTFLNFIVTAEGKIKSIKLLKGFKDCPECDREAMRVVGIMPDWKPAVQNGNRVSMYFTLPISFGVNTSGSNERKQEFSLRASEPESKAKELTPGEKAAKEKHDKAMKLHEMGIQQAQQERWEFAIGKFDQCLKIEPDNRYALSDKANMYVKLKRYREACETWAVYKSFGYQSEKVEGYIKQYCSQ